MPEREFEATPAKPMTKTRPIISSSPTLEKLLVMPDEQLIKMLLRQEMSKLENAPIRQRIIRILQERKGNAFVQSLLEGKTSSEK